MRTVVYTAETEQIDQSHEFCSLDDFNKQVNEVSEYILCFERRVVVDESLLRDELLELWREMLSLEPSQMMNDFEMLLDLIDQTTVLKVEREGLKLLTNFITQEPPKPNVFQLVSPLLRHLVASWNLFLSESKSSAEDLVRVVVTVPVDSKPDFLGLLESLGSLMKLVGRRIDSFDLFVGSQFKSFSASDIDDQTVKFEFAVMYDLFREGLIEWCLDLKLPRWSRVYESFISKVGQSECDLPVKDKRAIIQLMQKHLVSTFIDRRFGYTDVCSLFKVIITLSRDESFVKMLLESVRSRTLAMLQVIGLHLEIIRNDPLCMFMYNFMEEVGKLRLESSDVCLFHKVFRCLRLMTRQEHPFEKIVEYKMETVFGDGFRLADEDVSVVEVGTNSLVKIFHEKKIFELLGPSARSLTVDDRPDFSGVPTSHLKTVQMTSLVD